MWIALAINAALLLAEVVGGIVTGSLAVLADAGHLLSDVGAIVLALIAARLASLPAAGQRTFGYQRSEVLAALVNGLLLVAVSVGIGIAAIGRLSSPPSIEGGGVLAPARSDCCGSSRASCSAGASPKISPQASPSAMVKANDIASTWVSNEIGIPRTRRGGMALSVVVPQNAIAPPSAAPASCPLSSASTRSASTRCSPRPT